MDRIVREALAQYDLTDPKLHFIRHNQNITYRVTDAAGSYLMRIHRPVEGFSLGILRSARAAHEYVRREMELVEYVGKERRIVVQKPVRNRSGELVTVLSSGTPVTLLEWVPGVTARDEPLTRETGKVAGRMIADLHVSLANYYAELAELQNDFACYAYDRALLGRVEQELLSAGDAGHLDGSHVTALLASLKVIGDRMAELDTQPGMFGVVHADLNRSNLVVSQSGIVPIDFSLSGFGYYYFDISLLVSDYRDKEIRRSIKEGYEKASGQELPLRYVEPFFVLGVILFLACQHNRIHSEEWFASSMERWNRTLLSPLNSGKTFVL